MSNNEINNEIYVLKSACLLHDPPTKAWDICKGKNHEEHAEKIADTVLKDSALKNAKDELKNSKVKKSDYLAASVDRWLLSKIVGEDYHKFPYKKIKIKNIFNPSFSQVIEEELTDEKVEEFAIRLNKIVKAVKDCRLAYHVLYASYEPLWIKNGLPSSPADTRTPSHSVFDHNYATTSMINWFLEEENPKGILLYIDLGSVQRFIASSRKLSDLWLSSYLASALAWSVFWIFIRTLGPDVMVLPTCRGNSFYYHSLISELIANGVDNNVVKEIKDISREFAGYDPDEDRIPKYAIIPTTATLILPELNELRKLEPFKELRDLKDLENFVKKKYEEIWNKIYDKVIEECEHTDIKEEFDSFATYAGKLLKECKRFNFDKTPPLPIRVIALSTDKLSEFGFKEDSYSLYHYMFKLLAYEESKRKIYKYKPEENLDLYDMTSQHIFESWPEKSNKGFEYCTVCGSLPAIISLPSKEEEYNKYLKIDIEPVFSIGERLCPYCLIKRLLTREKILKPIIDELLGKISDDLPSRKFISVCDITLMPFKRSIVMKGIALDKDPELSEQLSKAIDNTLKETTEALGKGINSLKVRKPVLSGEKFLVKKIKEVSNRDLREQLEYLVCLDNAESVFMKDLKLRKTWTKLIRKINNNEMKEIGERVESLNTYYAIVRSDGDNLGKIIRGKIKDGFRVEVKDYLYNVLEGPSQKLINSILKKEKLKEVYEKEEIKNIDEKIEEISKLIDYLQSSNEIFISPSYHSTLSKALMDNAIRDAKIIDDYDGLVVYAGGDDLLAVMPVKDCLKAVKQLREKFSFPSEYEGFDKKYNYITPSMVTASRSFSVYLAHYMFPMYVAIGKSATLLDELAKETKWSFDNSSHDKETIVEKDTLVFSYSPRGKELSSLLPLSNPKSPNKNLAKALEYVEKLLLEIEEGKFSISLMYDFYNNFQTIELLTTDNKKMLLKNFLKKILEKNCEVKEEQQKHKKEIEWTEILMEDYNAKETKIINELLLKQFFLTLMLYRSGLRGVG
jgi:CRISPR-associated protein Cmr2